ncbi:hypothetical protein D2C82_00710 [Helicobacter pylori]|nr:hypothetical protein [Helicobacter pylori]QEF27727.1 hypothetical protein D2C82_00710 [Helicobacter pylori]
MYPKVILRSIGGFFGSFSSNASLIFSFIFSFFIVSSSFIFFLIPFSFIFSFIFFLRNHSYTQKKTQQTQK